MAIQRPGPFLVIGRTAESPVHHMVLLSWNLCGLFVKGIDIVADRVRFVVPVRAGGDKWMAQPAAAGAVLIIVQQGVAGGDEIAAVDRCPHFGQRRQGQVKCLHQGMHSVRLQLADLLDRRQGLPAILKGEGRHCHSQCGGVE